MADLVVSPSENGVSPDEKGVSTAPFILAQAPGKRPWSDYVPFAQGTDLAIEASVFGFAFKGTGKVDELTDTKLTFSVAIPVPDLPLTNPGIVSVTAKITYVAEGGSNEAEFSINGVTAPKKPVSIQSKTDERILSAPGGVEIVTGMKFPAPEKVTLRTVRIRRVEDQTELIAEFEGLIPSATIRASRKR
jgi:hypothetical protein